MSPSSHEWLLCGTKMSMIRQITCPRPWTPMRWSSLDFTCCAIFQRETIVWSTHGKSISTHFLSTITRFNSAIAFEDWNEAWILLFVLTDYKSQNVTTLLCGFFSVWLIKIFNPFASPEARGCTQSTSTPTSDISLVCFASNIYTWLTIFDLVLVCGFDLWLGTASSGEWNIYLQK